MHFLPFSVLENKFVFYRQIIHETQGRILTCSCQSMSVPTVFFLSFDWANTGILKWELNMFSWGVILESNLFSGNILVLISVVLCSLTFILLFNLFNYPIYDLLWVFIFTYIWPVLKTNMTNHSLLLCFFSSIFLALGLLLWLLFSYCPFGTVLPIWYICYHLWSNAISVNKMPPSSVLLFLR